MYYFTANKLYFVLNFRFKKPSELIINVLYNFVISQMKTIEYHKVLMDGS